MKIIKINYSIKIILLFMALSIFGCSDLTEVIYDETLDTDLVEDPNNAPGLVSPVYAQLRALNEFWGFWSLHQATTDEAMFPTRGTDWYDNGIWQQTHLHTWTPDHDHVSGAWSAIFTGISRANTALNYLSEFPQSADIDGYILELRFLRAYYIYTCVDLYGQVPFREFDQTDYSVPSEVKTRAEATAWLITELTEIIPSMELKSAIPYGRASKGAAQTLLAKIYLNSEIYTGTADWDGAITECDAVINSGEYSITNDYWAMFQYPKSTENEAIFVVMHDDNIDQGHGGVWSNFTLHYNQVFGNYTSLWNGGCTTKSFFDKWDPTDNRYYDDRNIADLGFNQGFLVGQQYGPAPDYTALEDRQGNPLIFTPDVNLTNASETEGIRVVKFAPDPQTERQFNMGNDFPIFRISDVYLMRAEAKLRNGDPGGALLDINEVRSRRGVLDLASVTLDNILDERGFELYWEGHRRQDLIRFGKYTEAYSEKPVTEAFRTIFPIPQSAMDVNPNLVQNPGY